MDEQLLNQEKRYIASCGYFVCINNELLGFSKVSGLTMEMNSEIYMEGGNDTLPYIMKKNENSNHVLTLEKGILKGFDEAVLNTVVPGCLMNDILIIIKKNTSEIDKIFYIEEGIVTKINYSNLDAGNGDILTVSLEISHTGLMEMN